jgi:hypothetical protein
MRIHLYDIRARLSTSAHDTRTFLFNSRLSFYPLFAFLDSQQLLEMAPTAQIAPHRTLNGHGVWSWLVLGVLQHACSSFGHPSCIAHFFLALFSVLLDGSA